MADPEEATQYYINKLADEEIMDDLSVLLGSDMPVAPFVKTLLTMGVMNGLHSIDVSIIIAPVIHAFIKAAMTSYGIEVRDDIGDPEEELKEREKQRLQTAITMAMADAEDKGASDEDPGVALLAEMQNTTGKTQVEMPEDDLNMDMEVSEPDAEPMGLMAKGA
jgi:2-methylaconitate cis-trans-isomerase PrpF